MKTSWPLLLLAGVLVVPVARAGVDVDISAEIRLGRAVPPPPPAVVIVEPSGPPGPPPWAPAHGFRRNRDYYYYPAGNVYYRPADRMWFYLEGSNWRAGVSLPAYVSVNFGQSVSLTMETDQPYVYHQQVVAYYPPAYFTKVKIKDRSGPGPKVDQRDRPPPGHGKEKSKKGRGKGHGRD